MHDFRWVECDGDFRFYSGTVATIYTRTNDKKDTSHGRGEMAYNNGKIAKGVWTKGILNVKVPPDGDRYVPHLRVGYSIGDVGLKD